MVDKIKGGFGNAIAFIRGDDPIEPKTTEPKQKKAQKTETDGSNAMKTDTYREKDDAMESSAKVMSFAEKTHHNLKIYKLKGQLWCDTAVKACDDFNDGCSVMINTEEANKDSIIRMVDFLSGVAYSQKGRLVKNGSTGFVIVPWNCKIGGDVGEDVFEDVKASFGIF